MEATTIPINVLSPSEAPPASKSIRAVVSLLWPYSSSTKQCALLLADPDFRLRNKKGQVRVRFTGASAEAVAKGRIGIGDELVLELGGAQWAGEQTRVATPGKSVDGELVYGGQLALSVSKKADGEESDVRIQVNETTPPPEEPEQPMSNGNHATPVRAAPLWMRMSMGGADVTPIYSSPAFVKRSRLSADRTSWDPFADVEKELEDNVGARKRQRISFGGVKRWKLTGRTPSPDKEDVTVMEVDAEGKQSTSKLDNRSAVEQLGESTVQSVSAAEYPLAETGQSPSRISGLPTMPPPPLPRLQLPSDPPFLQTQQNQQSGNADDDGPSTPKLHPVPSSALPLPSPFPTDGSQIQFGSQVLSSTTRPTALDALVEAADAARDNEIQRRTQSQSEQSIALEILDVITDVPEVVQAGSQSDHPQILSSSPAPSLASTAEIVRDDEDSINQRPYIDSRGAQQSMSTDVQHHDQHTVPEYLSDTEEDEDMYYDHMRRRFPSVTESGRVRVDHQEEGYYDELSQLHEDDAEEVIEPDDIGEEPESAEDESDEDVDDEKADEDDVLEISETPQEPVASLEVASQKEVKETMPVTTEKQSTPEAKPSPAANALESLTEAREEVRKENRETLKTPARPPPGLFGFDGAANDTPFQPKSTPQSEKERIMAKTFSSLFGFRASPSPELPGQQQPLTPTPAMPVAQSFLDTKEKFEAASIPVKDTGIHADVKQEQDMPDVAAQPDSDVADHLRDQVPSALEKETENFEALGATIEEAAEAVEETGDSLPATDVNDGSLLSAVHADEEEKDHVKHSGTDQTPASKTATEKSFHQAETPVINETPQVDVEMKDVHEDPVPDGVPINQKLGEAIAPERLEEPQQPPPSSAPIPTQVTVVDLGDSSDEYEQPPQAPRQVVGQTEERNSRLEPERDEPSYPSLTQQRMPAPSLHPPDRPSQSASRHVTQDSQGSALQSDMLDTTQTTVDRSEIATPIAEEYGTIIADTSQENGLWLDRNQPDGFFAEQVQNQEFEGAAMPQMTQQATATVNDPYHYSSFQSATSVATENSDNLPATEVQSFAEEQQQIESAPVAWPDQTAPEELAFSQHDDALMLDPALEMAETVDRRPIDLGQPIQIQEDLQDGIAMDVDVARPDIPNPFQSIEEMEVDRVQVPSFSQQAQRSETAQINSSLERHLSEEIALEQEPVSNNVEVIEEVVETEVVDENQNLDQQTIVRSEQASHPALPISPEDSQHRVESQGFETQIAYHSVSNELPPTPQLTQGDSKTKDELKVVVEEADQGVTPQEPTTPPRPRRGQKATNEALGSPAKKTYVRRSPRKTQEDAEEPAKVDVDTSHDSQHAQVTASQRRRRSVQLDTNHTLLSPTQQTPVRRSPRKSQAPTEALDKVAEREEEGESGDIASQTSPQQPSFPSTQKTPVRRSPRKPQVESQTSDKLSQDMEVATPAKRSGRQASRKQQTHPELESANGVKETEDMEDTISVTPPVKASTRQSARKSLVQMDRDQDEEMTDAQLAVPQKASTASRKSFTTQLGRVPAAIADWFSPRRSTRTETEAEETSAVAEKPVPLKREKSHGFSTPLSYFIPLSNLEEKLGPASQYQTDNTVDVLAVVTDETKAPERAKSGPRDYFTIFRITDSSLPAADSTRVEVFRPWHSTLPKAQVGEVVLLRAFAVKTRKRNPYLISTDSSAWCVWRFAENEGEGSDAENHVPVTRKRGASFSATSGAREETKGPPVELGEEERQRVAELRKWWKGLQKDDGAEENVQAASPRTTRSTRSQKL